MNTKYKADKIESENIFSEIDNAIKTDTDFLAFVCHTFCKAYPNIKKVINNYLCGHDLDVINLVQKYRCGKGGIYSEASRKVKDCPCQCESAEFLAKFSDCAQMMLGYRKPPMSNQEYENFIGFRKD